jgi:hypothetical protein
MQVQTRTERPRAFERSQMAGTPPPGRPPSWDFGPERRIDDGRTLARNLGWFSIGLGVIELFAPHRVSVFLGFDGEHQKLVRSYGVRELASGAAILSQRDPVAGVLSRIAGDTVDLATLAVAAADEDSHRGRVLGAMAMVAGVMALDLLCASQLRRFSKERYG